MITASQRHDSSLAAGPVVAVPRVSSGTLRDDPGVFYAALGDGPLVVTDALPDDPMVRDLTVQGLASLLAGGTVEAYARATGAREVVPAEDFFKGLRAGRGLHNVVDHPLGGTPLGGRVSAPGFLGSNWLPADRPDLGISPVSLTVSPAGNFTPLHIDAYGMQGWMLLLQGCKRWTFIAAREALAHLDPETAGVRDDDPARWAGVIRHEACARRGDLVFVPPGWAHQVLTVEESVGVGGSVINEHQIVAAMTAWLAERSLGASEEFDLAALVTAHAEGVPSDAGRVGVRAALAMYAAWVCTAGSRPRGET